MKQVSTKYAMRLAIKDMTIDLEIGHRYTDLVTRSPKSVIKSLLMISPIIYSIDRCNAIPDYNYILERTKE